MKFKIEIKVISFALIFFGFSTRIYSDDLLYTLLPGNNANSFNIQLNQSAVSNLTQNAEFDLPLPSGETVSAKVTNIIDGTTFSTTTSPGAKSIILSFSNKGGSLNLVQVNGAIVELILFDINNKEAFQAFIDASGGGELNQKDLNDYFCVDYPRPANSENPGTLAADIAFLVPDLTTLQNLESKPGATNTLYINYWGGSLAAPTGWHDSYGLSNPFPYSAYNTSGSSATFTATERYWMWLGWQEAAEDYAAYDINVTTSQAIFDAASYSTRSQMIATATNWLGAGGVAYVGSFGYTGPPALRYYEAGWVWNLGPTSLGMTISHEAGHQMGLSHDGNTTPGQAYDPGHGNWGPIMGAPFGQKYVQWSKGEYNFADRFQDDLAIINGKLGLRTDEAGSTVGTATDLAFNVVDYEGVISPNGLFSDVDVFGFDASGVTHIEVAPLLGDEGEVRAANIALNVDLIDADGVTTLASMTSADNSPLLPTTNTFVWDGTLATGKYYLRLDAESPDLNWTTGWNEYSNGGLYRINIDAASLPVELSYFGVESTNSGVLASWTTESETENLGFTLDRRVEGTDGWNQVATYQTEDALLGQGSTPSATDYEYLDALVTAGTTYEYRLADVDYKNTVTYHATRTVTVSSTPSTREVPDEFTVKEAYPNPFNPSTTIDYSLPVIASGAKQSLVSLQIYDITGKLITTLIDQVQPSGWHSVQWNGKDHVGVNVSAGAYLVRVKAGTDVRHTKVMLLK